MAGCLRFLDLGGQGWTVDEGMTLYQAVLAVRSPGEIPAVLRSLGEVHPPGWFLLVHGWARLGDSEAWLRALPALASWLALPLTWWLWAELSEPGRPACAPSRLAAGALLATSAYHAQYGRELRMYPWLGLLVLAALLCFLRYARTGRRGWWVAYTGLAAVAPWIHVFGWFLPLLSGVWSLRHAPTRLGAWLLATLIGLGLFLPWAPTLWRQSGAQDLGLRFRPGPDALLELIGRMSSADLLPVGAPSSQLLYLALAGVPLGLCGMALVRRRGLDAAAWLGLPVALVWAVSAFTPLRIFEFKYFVWCSPFLALLVGEGLELLAGWRRICLALLVCLQLGSWGLLVAHPRARNQDWRGVAVGLRSQAAGQALLLVHPSMMAAPLLCHGVPLDRLVPVDNPTPQLWERIQGSPQVWLVTTPYHPFVARQGLEARLDRLRIRLGQDERPAGAWLPSAVTRVVRYGGELPRGAEQDSAAAGSPAP